MLTLLLGGARSGKSRFAVSRGREVGGAAVVYIATASAGDAEMAARITRHRAARPEEWTTIEEPLDLVAALRKAEGMAPRAVIVDCLTLWLANLLEEEAEEERVLERIGAAAEAAKALGHRCEVVVVSNEVGLSLVPTTALGRRFRDLHGLMNQTWAEHADRVALMVAGLPLWLKQPE